MFPKILQPIYSYKKNLIRIGPKKDGGYVIDKRIINKTNYIITCGLNDDWEFEKEFLKYNKETKVIAYDHTVNNNFWFKKFLKDFVHFFLLKKLSYWKIKNMFSFIDYKYFFCNKNIHYQLMIDNISKSNFSININQILKNKKNVLLKVDIENAEYKILTQIIENSEKINCLIIEFHNIKKNINKIADFIKKNKFLKLIHLHCNNIRQLDKYNFPYAIEMTLINKKKINLSNKKTIFSYPIKELDYPNVKRYEDIKILFN